MCGGVVLKAALSVAQPSLSELQAEIDALRTQIATLQNRMTAAEGDIPDCMTTASGAGSVDDVISAGRNVHVRNGQGNTNGSNGVGNLVIGYNESGDGSPARGGSHNVVIGPEHSSSSYGGFVAGFSNTVSGKYASVSGGPDNTASNFMASGSGGQGNEASGRYASVSGGDSRTASGQYNWRAGGLSQSH